MTTKSLESAKRSSKARLREKATADAMTVGVAEAAKRWDVPERSLRRWVAEARAAGRRPPTPDEAATLEVALTRARQVRDEALSSVTGDLKRLVRMATDAAEQELEKTGKLPAKLIFEVAGAAKILGELDMAERVLLAPGETVTRDDDPGENRVVEPSAGGDAADDWH